MILDGAEMFHRAMAHCALRTTDHSERDLLKKCDRLIQGAKPQTVDGVHHTALQSPTSHGLELTHLTHNVTDVLNVRWDS